MENTSTAPPASSKHGFTRVPTWVLALIVPVVAGVAVIGRWARRRSRRPAPAVA